MIDPDGENLTLVDDSGHVLTDDEALLAFVTLVARHLDGGSIALPLSATAHAERLAEEHGVGILRTKMSNAALMEAASRPGVGFAANTEGGFILPRFLPAFDGAAAMVRMLELLALDGTQLSKVVGSLPRLSPRDDRETIGAEERSCGHRKAVRGHVDLVDGVKVHHDQGWALALPDPEEPVTHIWAEGGTAADAKRLAQEYARRIRQLLR